MSASEFPHLENFAHRCAVHPGAEERFKEIVEEDPEAAALALREALALYFDHRIEEINQLKERLSSRDKWVPDTIPGTEIPIVYTTTNDTAERDGPEVFVPPMVDRPADAGDSTLSRFLEE